MPDSDSDDGEEYCLTQGCKFNRKDEKSSKTTMKACGVCFNYYHTPCINLKSSELKYFYCCTYCRDRIIKPCPCPDPTSLVEKNELTDLKKQIATLKLNFNKQIKAIQEQLDNFKKESKKNLQEKLDILQSAHTNSLQILDGKIDQISGTENEPLNTDIRSYSEAVNPQNSLASRHLFSGMPSHSMKDRFTTSTFHLNHFSKSASSNQRSKNTEVHKKNNSKPLRKISNKESTNASQNQRTNNRRHGEMPEDKLASCKLNVLQTFEDYFIGNCNVNTDDQSLKEYIQLQGIEVDAIRLTRASIDPNAIIKCYIINSSTSADIILDSNNWPIGVSCHKLLISHTKSKKVWGTNTAEPGLKLSSSPSFKYILTNCPRNLTSDNLKEHLLEIGVEDTKVSSVVSSVRPNWKTSFIMESLTNQDSTILNLENWPNSFRIQRYRLLNKTTFAPDEV